MNANKREFKEELFFKDDVFIPNFGRRRMQ
jgi:hypothetical protein